MADPALSEVVLGNVPHILLGLGALAGFVARAFWLRAAKVDGKGGALDSRARRTLPFAYVTTGVALCLASAGYILGRFSGAF